MALALLAGMAAAPALEARDRRPVVWRGPTPVERSMMDLQRAARNARYVDRHERRHFDRAMSELARFQDRWRQGRFDKGRLDKAIDNIKHLVNSRRLHPGDRRMLAADLASLRDFRARGGYPAAYRGRYPW